MIMRNSYEIIFIFSSPLGEPYNFYDICSGQLKQCFNG